MTRNYVLPPIKPLFERWATKTEIPPAMMGCWQWKGAKQTWGYGVMTVNSKDRPAHHIAHELLIGPIPAGLQADHTCHTNDPTCDKSIKCPHRSCVNPFHLEWVTSAENTRRGRSNAAQTELAAKRLTCINGHLWSEHGYVMDGRKGRTCRQCVKDRSRASYLRRKALR